MGPSRTRAATATRTSRRTLAFRVAPMEPLDIAIPVASAFAVAAVTTPFVGRFARAIGAIDRPSDRGVNQRPDMPLCGGLAVASAFAVGLYAALELSEH